MLHEAAIGLLIASCVVGLAGIAVAFGAFSGFDKGQPYSPRAVAAGVAGAGGIVVALILLAVAGTSVPL